MSTKVERFTIERMGPEDVDQVARLEKICFSDPWSKSSFQHELTNRFSIPLVVKSGSTVVGYCCLWHVYEQMEIATIAVAPEFRGKGVGGTMMRWILEEAARQGCSSVVLSVRESNLTAIRLYRRFGFAELDRRKRYYRLPEEDAIIMIKAI
jgi:ribosomal-protein-alanine N-acetyltransferase